MALFKFFKAKKPSEKALEDYATEKEVVEQEVEPLVPEPVEQNEDESAQDSTPKTKRTSPRKKQPDKPVYEDHTEELASAVKLAYIGVLQNVMDESKIGEHIRFEAVDETLGLHYFEAYLPGYVGWEWTVALSLVHAGDEITIVESALTPGENGLVSPDWVPFKDRLKPSDISETDELPYEKDDPRLEEFLNAEDLEERSVQRMRVLSPYGKNEVMARWYNGNHGPNTASTRIAKDKCMSCGFFLPLAGDFGQLFGACANAWSRDDGRVVSSDHGCGMHSETDAKSAKRWKEEEFVVDQVTQVDFLESDDTADVDE
ncbi:MAG: DUF3027 domain-containing protein [Candidatus Ancillula sp.]|jgi:hypothetical protein|nr:DUF3027 domain-containing protein [Candidatus Ancillula sp.]